MVKRSIQIAVLALMAMCTVDVSAADKSKSSGAEKKGPPKESVPKDFSHAPTKAETVKSIDKADQKKGQAELRAEQERNRPKSDAEKASAKIGTEPKVGVITKPGPGIKVEIPTK